MQSSLETKFMNIYANLPINLRDEVIVVIDKKPITWNVAYFEVKNKTIIGTKILKTLSELRLI